MAGAECVSVPTPMLLHALTRELVILRRPLMVLGAVDQVHGVVDFSIAQFRRPVEALALRYESGCLFVAIGLLQALVLSLRIADGFSQHLA
jgi:hypothetical protein